MSRLTYVAEKAWRAAALVCALTFLVVVASPVGCGGGTKPVDPADASVPLSTSIAPPAVASNIDIAGAIRQVHFAYRKDGDAWSGGHATYAVRVDADATTVTPYHRHAADPEAEAAAPIVLRRAALLRGGRRIDAGRHDVSVAADGHLTIGLGGGVVEELRNDDEGVEQSWAFAARPDGASDLIARVPVGGLRFTGATDSGLHFVDDRTGVGVRYGHGTWIDASGARTRVPARWDGGAIALSVPATTVDGAAYPAVLDPAVSPEFGVDNPVDAAAPTYAPSAPPALAFDGTNYLVVYRDNRAGASGQYAIRVSSSGTVLDEGGRRLTSATGAPAVGFDGTNFFVAWSETRTGGAGADIYFTRVSSAGVPLDGSGKLLSLAAYEQTEPALAFDGTNFLVAWTDGRASNNDVYAARVTPAGTVLDPAGIVIASGSGSQQTPAVAYDGTNFLVVWEDNGTVGTSYDIYGIRVDSSGALVDAAKKLISAATADQLDPKIVFDGINYFVAWHDLRGGSAGAIYAMRVNVAGTPLDAAGGFMIAGSAYSKGPPTLAFDGTNYLVAWSERRPLVTGALAADIRGARVTRAGAVLDLGGVLLNASRGEQASPSLIYGPGHYFLVFSDGRVSETASPSTLYAARIASTATPIDPEGFPIIIGANAHSGAAVGTDGTNYLVVFADNRGGTWDLYGVRLDPTGAILDPSGIAIAVAPETQQFPDVSFNGTDYFVVWADRRDRVSAEDFASDIYGARVSKGGALVDATPIPIARLAKEQTMPKVAWDGTNFMVAWMDYRSTTVDIYAARVSAAGAVLDASGIVVSAAPGTQGYPAIAFDGTNYLVAWNDNRSGTDKIYFSRVSPVGFVMDPMGVQVATTSGNQVRPQLAFDGTNFLVVWEDYRSSGGDVYASRVTPAGFVIDGTGGIAVASAADSQSNARVAFDGTNWIVVYQDARVAADVDIRAARLSPAGVMLDTAANGFIVSGAGYNEAGPAIASNGKGQTLVTYAHVASFGTFTVDRRYGRFIDDSLGKSCSSATECTSGFCVDGVCCDKACGAGDPNDCMACSSTLSTGASGFCSPAKAGAVCRAATGTCDVAETCNGTSTSCPAEGFAAATTVCRASAGACDAAERCTGSSADCPSDSFAAATTVCRASAGPCDVAETCTGTSASCPDDSFLPASTVCRAAVGSCDVAENCSGSAAACPADAFAGSTTVCRSSAGPCDAEEKCSGSSTTCPSDGFLPATTECRPAAGACDVAERCSGASAGCPADGFSPSTTVCRASAGVCDVAESCTGSSADCPTDGFAPTTVVCRASAGACDVAESCTGGSASCPTNAFEPASTVCHASTDACDRQVLCSGSTTSCPTGGKLPGCCLTDAECNDGDACTTDSCVANSCSHVAISDCDAGPIDAGAEAGTDAATDAADAPTDTLVDSGVDTKADTKVSDTAAPAEDTGAAAEDTGTTEPEDSGATEPADSATPAPAPQDDGGGCGCRTAGEPSRAPTALTLLSLLLLVRRRRSSPRSGGAR